MSNKLILNDNNQLKPLIESHCDTEIIHLGMAGGKEVL